MKEKTPQNCDHAEIIQIENSNVFRCDLCGQLFSGAEILEFYKKQLSRANEGIWVGDYKKSELPIKTSRNKKQIKDTISVITLPNVLEDLMIDRITDYIMLLLQNQRQDLNSLIKAKMIDYCYDFAWHYGRLYHIGGAEKIKAAVSEKFRLPEEFISALLNSDKNVQVSDTTEAK